MHNLFDSENASVFNTHAKKYTLDNSNTYTQAHSRKDNSVSNTQSNMKSAHLSVSVSLS